MNQFLLRSISVFFAILLFSVQSFAFTLKASYAITKSEIQSVSEFDDSEIYDAFASIKDLDQYLGLNNGKTYSEVRLDNSALLSGVSSTTLLPLSASAGELALGIPSFLWGCVFGWVGLLIVYLVTDNDRGQTKKALWGCLANGLAIVVYTTIIFLSGYQ